MVLLALQTAIRYSCGSLFTRDMEIVIRVAIIYFFLLIMLRFAGKATLAETSTFEFVVLLIVSEAVQEAMMGGDSSLTAAFLAILTLVFLSIVMTLVRQRFKFIEKLFEDTPLIIVENGKILNERMNKSRIDEGDIMAAARQHQGLERLDQIKYAVLEKNGGITVIPK